MTTIVWIIVAIIVVICLYTTISFHRLVGLQNKIRFERTTYEAYLNQRWDMIPKIIDVIGPFMEHEKTVLEQIAKQRTNEYDKMIAVAKDHADSQLSSGLTLIMQSAESHEELKRSSDFTALKDKLNSLEWNIKSSKTNYDMAMERTNKAKNHFPSSLVATMFHL